MIKSFLNLSTLLILAFLTFNCSDNPSSSETGTAAALSNAPLFLLGLDSDPLGMEAPVDSPGNTPFGNAGPGHRGPGNGGPQPGGPFGQRGFMAGPAFAFDALGHFIEVLDLTEDQVAQIKDIAEKYQEAFQALRDEWQNGASWQEIQEQRKALREAFLTEITPILTPEQQATLQEMQAKFEQGRVPGNVTDKRLDILTEKLDLTAEQQDQIKPLLEDASVALLEARENSENLQAFQEAAKAIFDNLDANILAVLTDEQIALYNELKEQFRRGPGHPPFHHGGF